MDPNNIDFNFYLMTGFSEPLKRRKSSKVKEVREVLAEVRDLCCHLCGHIKQVTATLVSDMMTTWCHCQEEDEEEVDDAWVIISFREDMMHDLEVLKDQNVQISADYTEAGNESDSSDDCVSESGYDS